MSTNKIRRRGSEGEWGREAPGAAEIMEIPPPRVFPFILWTIWHLHEMGKVTLSAFQSTILGALM